MSKYHAPPAHRVDDTNQTIRSIIQGIDATAAGLEALGITSATHRMAAAVLRLGLGIGERDELRDAAELVGDLPWCQLALDNALREHPESDVVVWLNQAIRDR